MYSFPFFTARVSMPPGFEPNCGSVRPKQPMALPCCKSGSHLSFCASEPKAWIGYITERRLHGNEAAQAGIAAFEFLGDEAVFDVGHARAAVALQARAEKSELGHLRDELHGKLSFAIVLLDDGHDFGVDELARGIASEFFLVGEDGVEVEVIDSGE